MEMEIGRMFLSAVVLVSSLLLWRFLEVFWWKPRSIAAKIEAQGIHGPPYKLMRGNLVDISLMRRDAKKHDMDGITHDVLEHLLPQHCTWSKQYGKRYVYWWGPEPRIMVSEPELIREIVSKKVSQFQKSDIMVRAIVVLIGRGLAAVNGDEWSHHRRVVSPAFHLEKLKNMIDSMAKCTDDMLNSWETGLQNQPELDVAQGFHKLTADVISHTAFGSSYAKGQRVFEILSALPEHLSMFPRINWLPGFRHIPLPVNFRIKRMQRELNNLILGIINERRQSVKTGRSDSYGNDLLGLMLTESEHDKSGGFTDSMLVDECRTFYFAGHETTASLLSWSVMLLAAYPTWQERARAEVVEVCKGGVPDGDMINKLKVIGMILYESLRLYPPFMLFHRACFEDTKLEDGLYVPKGAAVTFPMMAIHRDKELWGEDANEFNPDRFRDGISRACKHPNAFLAFSLGPRVCVGQSFTLIEAKVVLSAILQRYSFQLSPHYRHNPWTKPALKPLHGLPLIINKYQSSSY